MKSSSIPPAVVTIQSTLTTIHYYLYSNIFTLYYCICPTSMYVKQVISKLGVGALGQIYQAWHGPLGPHTYATYTMRERGREDTVISFPHTWIWK